MRELFVDCSAGVAGDMLSAALLELFEDREGMLRKLNSLGIPGIEFKAERVRKHSVMGTQMKVRYLGIEEEDNVCTMREHRTLCDVSEIIDKLNMPQSVKNDVRSVYRMIADAEAEAHGCPVEHVHFHELGAMDAVADISAVCYMVSLLKPEHITASPVCTGFGEIQCAHGILPVPAPATAYILKDVPSFAGDTEGELCTPTGAALVKYLAQSFSEAPLMTVHSRGCGMGRRDFPMLSAVRVSLGDSEESIIELSCNVDDMSPEAVGFAIDELLRCGAPDAYYEAIGMKKNRPGLLLTCLCRESQRDEMVRLMFRHTTTLGIRETLCRRYVLRREQRIAETPFGAVRVKLSEGYGIERRKAEFDDLKRLARENDLTIDELKELAERMCDE